ncbi:hypothetical protein, partial [Candidatus Oscillochloris fontis]|uniref:hypothetical protein n=1 Tax=Candidatus Oscillochloris fontis TaxID=2496868 RepID=UPI001EE97156
DLHCPSASLRPSLPVSESATFIARQPRAQHRLAGDAAGAAWELGAFWVFPGGQTSFGSREVASGAPEGWRWAWS